MVVWTGAVYLNALVPYLIAYVALDAPRNFHHLQVHGGLMTVAAGFIAFDLVVIRRLANRRAITAAMNTAILILASLQVVPIFHVLMGTIAVAIIGLHIPEMRLTYPFGAIGSEWSPELQVYATVVLTGMLVALPVVYAGVRTAWGRQAPPGDGRAGQRA